MFIIRLFECIFSCPPSFQYLADVDTISTLKNSVRLFKIKHEFSLILYQGSSGQLCADISSQ